MAIIQLPPGVKAIGGGGGWAGSDTSDPKNELDLWVVGDDGNIYHAFLHPGSQWVDEIAAQHG